MVYWLLVELLPVRQIALIVLIGAALQLGGVDVIGMIMTELVDPIVDWFTQEAIGNLW
jgi:hypothetical protein